MLFKNNHSIVYNAKRVCNYLLSQLYRRDLNIWIFGEWFGDRCCDNVLYFANYIAEKKVPKRLVWITKTNTNTKMLHPNIEVVAMDSLEAKNLMKTAGVAIMCQGTCDFSAQSGELTMGALSVNLWHGIPIKKIGRDSDNSVLKNVRHIVKRKLNRSYYLAVSEEHDRIMQSAFSVSKDRIIRTGQPRNSLFYSEESLRQAKANVKQKVLEQGDAVKSFEKIIVYMPTFRDTNQYIFSFDEIGNKQELIELLERNDCILIQKGHYISNKRNCYYGNEKNSRIVRLEDVSAQELLASADLLITDYSSCYLDYLILDRPIIHFLYDGEYYCQEDRGLYHPIEEVAAGDIITDEKYVISAIESNLMDPSKNFNRRQIQKNHYLQYEERYSCEQVYQHIVQQLNRL